MEKRETAAIMFMHGFYIEFMNLAIVSKTISCTLFHLFSSSYLLETVLLSAVSSAYLYPLLVLLWEESYQELT